ncbi:MAG: hypothetical protein LBC85_11325 [Fibromonadaceae bacterium]|jgi:hypothetical protein|nr:hypothetical protein [Fibromonadaceae bacterium]
MFAKKNIVFLVAALALSFAFTGFYKAPNLPEIREAEAFVPRTEAVRWMSLGHNSAAASLFWISGILAYSETMFDGKTFQWLSHLANASTRLDSLFKTPYTFVAAVTANNEPDTTDYAVLLRGIEAFPDDWRLAVSAAFRFANGPGQNFARAAEIMRAFEGDTAVPPHIRTIWRTFDLRSMPIEIAIIQILDDSLNPDYKAFQRGLAIKAARVLESQEIDKIEAILGDAVRQKIPPEEAFAKLMAIPNNPLPEALE